MIPTLFCDHTWSGVPTSGSSTEHHCERRPGHRGDHVCSCRTRQPRDPDSPWKFAGAVRRFVLDRLVDVSGVSGTGVVAEGVEFSDGAVALRWLGPNPSTAAWDSIEQMEAIHGHEGRTTIRWVDAA